MKRSSSQSLAAGFLSAFMCISGPGAGLAHMPGGMGSAPPQTASPSAAQRNLAIGPAFDGLLRHDGQVFDRRQLAGKPTLIFFGYVSCSTVCPVALNTITLAVEELERQYGRDAVPNILFLTTLPEQEGTDQVADFIQHFDPRIVALAAQKTAFGRDPATLKRVRQVEALLTQFRIVRDDHHAPFAYLMGADGRFVGRPLNTQNAPEEMARAIAGLLRLSPRQNAAPAPSGN